jgi:hypothetical protein
MPESEQIKYNYNFSKMHCRKKETFPVLLRLPELSNRGKLPYQIPRFITAVIFLLPLLYTGTCESPIFVQIIYHLIQRMKKFILSASLLAMSFVAWAQDDFKPMQGDVTAEFSYGGLFNSSQLGLNSGGLRFRYFLADELAARIGFNVSSNSTTNNILNYSNNQVVVDGFAKESRSTVDLNLGAEKHLSGTDRLATYVGADLRVRFANEKMHWQNTENGSTYRKDVEVTGKQGSTGFGLRVVGGAEYYFIEKVYLGGEFGWGFLASRKGDAKATYKNGVSTSTTVPASNEAKEFNLSPSVIGSVRLGFRF